MKKTGLIFLSSLILLVNGCGNSNNPQDTNDTNASINEVNATQQVMKEDKSIISIKIDYEELNKTKNAIVKKSSELASSAGEAIKDGAVATGAFVKEGLYKFLEIDKLKEDMKKAKEHQKAIKEAKKAEKGE